jgi:hypothetical protein
MISAALTSAVLFAALPVRVQSQACPSGPQVEQLLASMLPSISHTVRPDLARVERRAGGLHIELSQAQGAVIAERMFDRDGSCAELAELAAVAIASWESDVHPEFGRPHVEPGPAPVLAAQPPTPMAYDAALGASLSHAGSFAAGGVLALTWIARGKGPGLRLLAAVEGERTVDLGVGRARWRRWMGSAELAWRLARTPLDFHGGLALGWLTASGADFSAENRSSLSFSSAATLGVRLSWWATRTLALWLDLTGLYWTRSQTVYAEPTGREQEIPRLQGVASLGLAAGRVATGR